MHNNHALFSRPIDPFTENVKTISRNGRALGFLEAMDIVGTLSAFTSCPVEAETLNRVYVELERGYSERFKGTVASLLTRHEKNRPEKPVSEIVVQVGELLRQADTAFSNSVIQFKGKRTIAGRQRRCDYVG
ncbi:hypothetical protein [uncultured Desulfosarcina sp.]|uniref:hypothetical protein n=1 Tax=uncultured Desulfosarcina sp. TaxID=218289 RepID=UPI0029C86B6C|nr:hypothetical protein [uncultured Desulfosarcina sp.]